MKVPGKWIPNQSEARRGNRKNTAQTLNIHVRAKRLIQNMHADRIERLNEYLT